MEGREIMERVTKRDVEGAFSRAFPEDMRARDIGAGGTNAHNVGRFFLDYAACYGGWEVGVYADGDSGAGWCHGTPPWGHVGRKPAREMVAWLHGVAAGRELDTVYR